MFLKQNTSGYIEFARFFFLNNCNPYEMVHIPKTHKVWTCRMVYETCKVSGMGNTSI